MVGGLRVWVIAWREKAFMWEVWTISHVDEICNFQHRLVATPIEIGAH